MATTTLISERGYPVEEHHVTTKDGYVLSVYRIPPSDPVPGDKVVLLMHGFLTSSADWVTTPPDRSLGFYLSRRGYDVWLGNFRGNTHGRKHIKLKTSDPKFWDFGLDEMARFDLPAIIDHILATCQIDSLKYMGFSMGSTVAFAMLSSLPEYNSKVKLFVAMGPVATLSYTSSLVRYVVPIAPFLLGMMRFLGMFCLFSNHQFLFRFANRLPQLFLRRPCNFLCLMDGTDASKFQIQDINKRAPAGSSVKNFDHFAQIIRTRCFRKYDYGKEENLKRYGEKSPPEYELTKVRTPVALIWSLNDCLANPVDVALLKQRLGSTVVRDVCVSDPTWSHLDFIWNPEAPAIAYCHVLEALDSF